MKILLHVCCGPCAVAVMEWLLDKGHDVTGLFFNPNIQPLSEYMRRREAALQAAERYGITLLTADTFPWKEQIWHTGQSAGYPEVNADKAVEKKGLHSLQGIPPAAHPVPWLQLMHGRGSERCPVCWATRLAFTARVASARGFDAMTSSLLYSRYQDHAVLRKQGETIASKQGLDFVYHDFREFWQYGIDRSKDLELYRQPYCGCMFSEYERYAKKLGKMLAK